MIDELVLTLRRHCLASTRSNVLFPAEMRWLLLKQEQPRKVLRSQVLNRVSNDRRVWGLGLQMGAFCPDEGRRERRAPCTLLNEACRLSNRVIDGMWVVMMLIRAFR